MLLKIRLLPEIILLVVWSFIVNWCCTCFRAVESLGVLIYSFSGGLGSLGYGGCFVGHILGFYRTVIDLIQERDRLEWEEEDGSYGF